VTRDLIDRVTYDAYDASDRLNLKWNDVLSAARPVALITGITGQDGIYLSELLLREGYEVHGTTSSTTRLPEPRPQQQLPVSEATQPEIVQHPADLTDGANLANLLEQVQPREVYHLAAQSDVRLSFQIPLQTANTIVLGTLRVLEAIRTYQRRTGQTIRFYQAASSEIFGLPPQTPQTETTPFYPRTPYACAKAFAFWQTVNYREAYGLFACNGILYNHESPRRGELYVTRKITRAAGRIKVGLQKKLYLGHLDSKRDWGFAGDYVEAMWRMLQIDQPEDFVIATGETHTVREFLEESFGHLNLDWREYVEIDAGYFRPTDVGILCGNAEKAKRLLGWEPKVDFRSLVRMLTDHDHCLAQAELEHSGMLNVLDPAT
jgi:GDPmannose 4,6-dehydratase